MCAFPPVVPGPVAALLEQPDLDPEVRRTIAGDCLALGPFPATARCALVTGHEGQHERDGVTWP
jgi:hypothetical protein